MQGNVNRLFLVFGLILLFVAQNAVADVGTSADDVASLVANIQKEVASYQKAVSGLQEEVKVMQAELKNKNAQINVLKKDYEGLKNAVAASKGSVAVASVPSGNVPSWVQRTHFGGDIRVRWETDLRNKEADKHKGKIRLRYGIAKQVNEELKAGFRMSISDSNSRSSFYTTMGSGSQSGFDKYDVYIDQAYLKYTPDRVQGLTIWGGKFKPNWKHKGILIQGEGTGFDGLGQSYVHTFDNDLKGEVNLAQLIVSESTNEDGDSEMYVFDAAIKGAIDTDSSPFTWGIRGTAYVFAGYHDGGVSALGGNNSSTLEDPRPILGTIDLGFTVKNIPVSLFVQGGLNLNERTKDDDVRGQDLYYAFGATFNTLKNPGDWNLGYKYAYLERNFIPSQLPTADVGVGNQSHIIYANYRWFPSTDLNWTLVIPRSLDGDSDSEKFVSKVNLTTMF